MVDLIILSLVKYSDGNSAIYQLHFANNGVLNGYTKAMIITMTAIIIALQLGVCKFRMAHNDDGSSSTGFNRTKLSNRTNDIKMQYISITTNTRITATVC